MPIKKLADGRYEVDCRPDGSYGYRTRRIFPTKNEATHYHSKVMGRLRRGGLPNLPSTTPEACLSWLIAGMSSMGKT